MTDEFLDVERPVADASILFKYTYTTENNVSQSSIEEELNDALDYWLGSFGFKDFSEYADVSVHKQSFGTNTNEYDVTINTNFKGINDSQWRKITNEVIPLPASDTDFTVNDLTVESRVQGKVGGIERKFASSNIVIILAPTQTMDLDATDLIGDYDKLEKDIRENVGRRVSIFPESELRGKPVSEQTGRDATNIAVETNRTSISTVNVEMIVEAVTEVIENNEVESVFTGSKTNVVLDNWVVSTVSSYN